MKRVATMLVAAGGLALMLVAARLRELERTLAAIRKRVLTALSWRQDALLSGERL